MRKRLWLVALVLLAIPLAFLLHDLARDVIVAQVEYALWWAGIVLNSVPQLPLWTLFVLVMMATAVWSLVSFLRPPREDGAPSPLQIGRLRVLAERIERSRTGNYYRWDVARRVGALILEALAYEQHTPVRELRRQLRSGQLDLPPEIQDYLLVGLSPIYTLANTLTHRVRRLFTSDAEVRSYGQALERAVRFLEEQTEALHER